RSATATHSRTRADSANQANKPASHDNHCGTSGRRFGEESTQRSVRTLRFGLRLGSALSLRNALSISTRLGLASEGVGGPAVRAAARVGASHAACVEALPISATASSAMRLAKLPGEGTTEFLLDVPSLELDATVQVHRETRGHIEGLEKEHHCDIRDRARER